MKTMLKRIALTLAALMAASSMAAVVSAVPVYAELDPDDCFVCPVCHSYIAKDDGCDNYCFRDGKIVKIVPAAQPASKQIFVGKEVTQYVPVSKNADPCKPGTVFFAETTTVAYPSYRELFGAKFYKPVDAKKELENYFDLHTCEMNLVEGQKRTFCKGAYCFSEDPSVAYFNYKTGEIVGYGAGVTYLYVYTTGGIPFYRIKVSVGDTWNMQKGIPTLNVIPEKWILAPGEKTTFTVTASDGKTYDDIQFSVWKGAEIASIGAYSGNFTAEKNGVVIVRAESKSNYRVYGEALLFIGDVGGAVYNGCWSQKPTCISVDSWCCDFYQGCGSSWYYPSIYGWIKSTEGIMIPVIEKTEGTILTESGSKTSTVISGDSVSLYDLLFDKDELPTTPTWKDYKHLHRIYGDTFITIDENYEVHANALGELLKDILGK